MKKNSIGKNFIMLKTMGIVSNKNDVSDFDDGEEFDEWEDEIYED